LENLVAIALAISLLHGRHAAFPLPVEGSYTARTLNGRALPADLRIPVPETGVRLFRLEQGVLRLSGGGRFTLHFRYYHQLVRNGQRPTATPVMSDSETGTYSFKAGNLVMTPGRKAGSKRRPPISATISGEEIRASYLLKNAGSNQPVTLVLRRDASYW
jgi:hypothetical protein